MLLYKAFICVLLMAMVTYLPRVLPIAIFRKKIKSPFVKSFLHYIPYAVLASLTFPNVFYSTGNVFTAICGTIVAFFLAYKNQKLLVVAISAIVTVFLTGFLF